jgi:SAM-dependent methyltransferase/uncharacterized protein YbaR (Trm112 family)
MILSKKVRQMLVCPDCKSGLERHDQHLCCSNRFCARRFPIVDDVPILINSDSSTFNTSSYRPAAAAPRAAHWRSRLLPLVPRISLNVTAKENYRHFRDRLLKLSHSPVVLVIGGARLGEGMQEITQDKRIEFVAADIAISGCTQVVGDAHDLPFQSAVFDGVIIQAVLEYLLDPARAVAEIYRVLKPAGVVYSETPFMQQVHGGRYDFTRFTHLGHRTLFRRFAEIRSGVCGGPGMALAWSLQYFLMSFTSRPAVRDAIKVMSRCSLFWLKYFDLYLARRTEGFDAAAGTYFLGAKSAETLSNRQLIQSYRGTVDVDLLNTGWTVHA